MSHPLKTALVTGATSGIGKAMALALARQGHPVIAVGRNAAALRDLSAQLPGIEALPLDLTDPAAIATAFAGREIDILVNNAGVMPAPGPFDRMEAADIQTTLMVNLGAVMALTQVVLPQMRARGLGHIFFTGSTAGHGPLANFAVYSASKAGLSAFATALRGELSPDGIRVTELVPGRVETGLYAAVLPEDTRRTMYQGDLALQPEDLADAMMAVLNLPQRADVARLDIVPTRPVPPIQLR